MCISAIRRRPITSQPEWDNFVLRQQCQESSRQTPLQRLNLQIISQSLLSLFQDTKGITARNTVIRINWLSWTMLTLQSVSRCLYSILILKDLFGYLHRLVWTHLTQAEWNWFMQTFRQLLMCNSSADIQVDQQVHIMQKHERSSLHLLLHLHDRSP